MTLLLNRKPYLTSGYGLAVLWAFPCIPWEECGSWTRYAARIWCKPLHAWSIRTEDARRPSGSPSFGPPHIHWFPSRDSAGFSREGWRGGGSGWGHNFPDATVTSIVFTRSVQKASIQRGYSYPIPSFFSTDVVTYVTNGAVSTSPSKWVSAASEHSLCWRSVRTGGLHYPPPFCIIYQYLPPHIISVSTTT